MKRLTIGVPLAIGLMGVLCSPLLFAHYGPAMTPSALPGCAIDGCSLQEEHFTNKRGKLVTHYSCINGGCPTPANDCVVRMVHERGEGTTTTCDCSGDQHCSLVHLKGKHDVITRSCEIPSCGSPTFADCSVQETEGPPGTTTFTCQCLSSSS
jgi:hypothetical protein